ncbi:MAG: hypothetical protein ACR2HJ_12255 [Fimbriimonadales bacterium]
MKALIPVFIVAYALAGCSATRSTSADQILDDGLTLKMNGKLGDQDRYRVLTQMTLDMSNMAQPNGKSPKDTKMTTSLSMDTVNTLKSVAEGKFTWAIKIANVQVTGNMPGADAAAKQLKGKESTVVLDERGKMLAVKGELEQIMGTSGGSIAIELPSKKIHVGETWDTVTEASGAQITTTYKANRIEQVDGEDALYVTGTIKPNSTVKNEGPVKAWISIETGRILKSEATIELIELGGAKVKASITKVR